MWIAGVDEAGRGPIAGPVAAAAVVLDPADVPAGLADSKLLKEAAREALFAAVCARAVAVSVALAPAGEIDRVNIRQATLAAMARAVAGLAMRPGLVLVDGRDVPPGLGCAGRAIIDGDALEPAIMASSIIAKVTRDRLMGVLDRAWPGYGFGTHKGYPTAAHLAALRRLGVSPVHRRSFAPVRALLVTSNGAG
jgi:ribonuclease HII